MIPKIIHYCWFGRGKLPPMVEMCIDSWRKYCPDYTIKLWNEDNSPMDVPWVKEAYRHQKYAFVADYVRFYALYQEGGVYMDTDMLIVKPIDALLINHAFLGKDDDNVASMGIIGAEKGDALIEEVMKWYNSSKFDLMRLVTVPDFVAPLMTKYGHMNNNKTQVLENGWVVYQTDYFYPIPFGQAFILNEVLNYATLNTYGIHLWNFSWSDEFDLFREGKLKQALLLVWKRFLRTPILPYGYWKSVIKCTYRCVFKTNKRIHG